MSTLPDASVDMILCDLPYGTTQAKWDCNIPLADLWEAYHRLCKPGAAMIFTAVQPFTSILTCSNLREYKHNWVWKKNKPTNFANATHSPMRELEDVLVFRRNGRGGCYNPQGLKPCAIKKSKGQAGGDLLGRFQSNYTYVQQWTGYPRQLLSCDSDVRRQHPTQKPVALMEYLISTYSNPGDTILDNCMGSGTTGVACKNLGRNFIGMEQDAGYFAIAQERLSK